MPTAGGYMKRSDDDDHWEFIPQTSVATATEFEVNLCTFPCYSGSFVIPNLTGLTPDKLVRIYQKATVYTGKGTLKDEVEMDRVSVSGYVESPTQLRCHWTTDRGNGPVQGNVKFGYMIAG